MRKYERWLCPYEASCDVVSELGPVGGPINVWKLHGLPGSALSDRGPHFMAEFMCKLYHLLGITISASTVYHPQSDGQTKCVNQELEQYIHVFVNECQSDWDTLLPLGEFVYNNHVHSLMQHSPFFIDPGRNLQMGFEPDQHPSKLEAANEFVDWMKLTLDKARWTRQRRSSLRRCGGWLAS
jgi:hypothetical protein